jgi:drug/metabolite transporter (DMT)-like permease
VWLGVALAGAGLVLLGVNPDFTVNAGDPWVLACAGLWAVHVVVVGAFSRDAEPIRFSLIQLGMTGVASLATMFAHDGVRLDAVVAAKWALLYAAVFPVAIAFTLQVVAQKKAPPTHTALILSLESVFGMLCGIVFLSERPTLQQYAGAALMLAGVAVSQLIQPASVAEADRAIADDPQPR